MTFHASDLVRVFEREAALLDDTLRRHPRLDTLFAKSPITLPIVDLAAGYLQLLKAKADYVRFTVPALRAAGEALRDGDDEDRGWSEQFMGYAEGEGAEGGGHEAWAISDMKALGAPPDLVGAPCDAAAVEYGRYFVDAAP